MYRRLAAVVAVAVSCSDSPDTVEGNTSNAVRLETRGTRYIVLAARVTTWRARQRGSRT